MKLFVVEGLAAKKSLEPDDRIFFLHRDFKELKDLCICFLQKQYKTKKKAKKKHVGEDEKKSWRTARKILKKIDALEWKEDVELLERYKAQAYYCFGTACKERGDYDGALESLTKAKTYIERQTAQYCMFSTYIRICIGLAKCYTEKHSPIALINECFIDAEQLLNDIGDEKDPELVSYVKLELYLQQAISELDVYGQREHLDYNRIRGLLEKADLVYTNLGKKNADNGNEIPYENWKQRQEITLLTTEGEFCKKLYFEATDYTNCIADDTKKESGLKEIDNYITIFYDRISPRMLNKIDENRSITQKCVETAFYYFSEAIKHDKKNTICLGNIAALLYDFCDDEFAERLLEHYFHFMSELEAGLNREEKIHFFVDKVLSIEPTNMYALNVKAALHQEKEGTTRIQDVSNYTGLRQSSLKKRFRYLQKELHSEHLEEFQKIEIQLIILYQKISQYMNAAIIDFEEEWKNVRIGHYTRLEVLPKLINKNKDSRMRIQNVHHLNDPIEGTILIKRIEKTGKEMGLSILEALLQLYNSEKSGMTRNSIYMGSFTSRLDQLNMWAQYGDGGKGCSIEVDTKFFDKKASVSLAEASTDEIFFPYKLEDERYPLYMVVYLPEDENYDLEQLAEYAKMRQTVDEKEAFWWKKQSEMIKKLQTLIDEVLHIIKEIDEVFKELKKQLENELPQDHMEQAGQEICNIIMAILDMVRFLFKSDYYRDEREYRIIQHSSDPEYDSQDTGIPKLYISLERPLIYKRVTFGPLVKNFDSKASYILNIKKDAEEGERKKKWEIEVEQSRIPFRSLSNSEK